MSDYAFERETATIFLRLANLSLRAQMAGYPRLSRAINRVRQVIQTLWQLAFPSAICPRCAGSMRRLMERDVVECMVCGAEVTMFDLWETGLLTEETPCHPLEISPHTKGI